MAGHRQDFVEREIARLRTFVATLSPDTAPAEIERALRLALDLQAGLFPLPAAEFLALEAPAQLEKLSAGQHPDDAAERRGKFIELLTHTAGLYALLGRDDFAAGARRHALHLALLDDASGPTDASARLVELLRAGLDEAALSAPVRSLLASFDGRAG
jgi:hypothetical protein